MSEHAHLGDGELVRRVLDGEVEAYRVLMERYRPEFARYAASLCGDGDTAADAMQDAFIRAYDALAQCRHPSRFKGWFFRILTNQCHNHRNRKRAHVPLDAIEAAADDRTDGRTRRSELREAIDAALEELTPEQREAFVLKHVEGRSYAEMAELLGTGEDALKMRVYRARDALKELLEAYV